MPREGYQSLTLRDEAVEKFRLATIPYLRFVPSQSDFILAVLAFIDENHGDFVQLLKRRKLYGS